MTTPANIHQYAFDMDEVIAILFNDTIPIAQSYAYRIEGMELLIDFVEPEAITRDLARFDEEKEVVAAEDEEEPSDPVTGELSPSGDDDDDFPTVEGDLFAQTDTEGQGEASDDPDGSSDAEGDENAQADRAAMGKWETTANDLLDRSAFWLFMDANNREEALKAVLAKTGATALSDLDTIARWAMRMKKLKDEFDAWERGEDDGEA